MPQEVLNGRKVRIGRRFDELYEKMTLNRLNGTIARVAIRWC